MINLDDIPFPRLGELVVAGHFWGKIYSKGRPRFSGNGHAYTPKNTRDFEKAVKNWAIGVVGEPVDYPCSVELNLFDAVPKSGNNWLKYLRQDGLIYSTVGDLDNRAKSILDAVNEVIFLDDKQVVKLYIDRRYRSTPGFYLTVKRAGYSAAELDELERITND